jgi:hypothetical protein
MNLIDKELKDMFKTDLESYLIFYMFKKYLSMFPAKDIPNIADAIAQNWGQNMIKYCALANQEDMDDFPEDVNEAANQLLISGIEKTASIIYQIAKDAYAERQMLENLYNPTPDDILM